VTDSQILQAPHQVHEADAGPQDLRSRFQPDAFGSTRHRRLAASALCALASLAAARRRWDALQDYGHCESKADRVAAMATAPLLAPPAGCVLTDVAYYASGVALSSSTGSRGFATDEQGTIWQNNAVANPTPAPLQPFTVAANVSPIQ
jgi:hypothetical protein